MSERVFIILSYYSNFIVNFYGNFRLLQQQFPRSSMKPYKVYITMLHTVSSPPRDVTSLYNLKRSYNREKKNKIKRKKEYENNNFF